MRRLLIALGLVSLTTASTPGGVLAAGTGPPPPGRVVVITEANQHSTTSVVQGQVVEIHIPAGFEHASWSFDSSSTTVLPMMIETLQSNTGIDSADFRALAIGSADIEATPSVGCTPQPCTPPPPGPPVPFHVVVGPRSAALPILTGIVLGPPISNVTLQIGQVLEDQEVEQGGFASLVWSAATSDPTVLALQEYRWYPPLGTPPPGGPIAFGHNLFFADFTATAVGTATVTITGAQSCEPPPVDGCPQPVFHMQVTVVNAPQSPSPTPPMPSPTTAPPSPSPHPTHHPHPHHPHHPHHRPHHPRR